MSAADGMLSAPIATSCAATAFSRASKRRHRAADERVLEQILGEPAEGVLAPLVRRSREPVAARCRRSWSEC